MYIRRGVFWDLIEGCVDERFPAGRSSDPAPGFESPASACSGLADSLEQIARRSQFQAPGEDHDRLETRGALRALQQADLGAVQVADVGEHLLGEADFFAMEAQVGGELLAGGFHSPNFRGPQTEGLQTEDLQAFVCKIADFTRRTMVGKRYEPISARDLAAVDSRILVERVVPWTPTTPRRVRRK
jgi:hypothetical protein